MDRYRSIGAQGNGKCKYAPDHNEGLTFLHVWDTGRENARGPEGSTRDPCHLRAPSRPPPPGHGTSGPCQQKGPLAGPRGARFV